MTTEQEKASLKGRLLAWIAGPRGIVLFTYPRIALLFLFHALVFCACYAVAFLLRFEFDIPPEALPVLRSTLPIVVGLQLLVGVIFGFYRGWWQYVGITDVVRLLFGLSLATAVLLVLWYVGDTIGLEDRFTHIPRGTLLIDWAFALLTLFGARVLIRLGKEQLRSTEFSDVPEKRVLIVGAGDAGESLAREIEHRRQLGLKVVGFVDDHRAKWGSQIRGIKVYGPISSATEIARELSADEALIAIPSAPGNRMREIIDHVSKADVEFKTVPGLDHLVTGSVHVSHLRPEDVEDLFRRSKIELAGDRVRNLIRGKRVLVTGPGGITADSSRQVVQYELERLTLLDAGEYATPELLSPADFDTAGFPGSDLQGDWVDAVIERQPTAVARATPGTEAPPRVEDTFLPFARPDVDGAELEEIRDSLERGWITTGPKTKQFERDFASFVGAKHAIAVNSCTAALHLALEAAGVQSGDEVITTPYTFAATGEVIRYFGARPVFVDVDPVTLNIRPDLIAEKISSRTRAIIPVHIAGLSSELDEINAIAESANAVVIEDAAHSFPSRYKGRMIGSISPFTAFSFYATKTITTGEGGMLCTDDDQWADRCRIMSLHGISRDAWKRYTAEGSWYYEIVAPGYKYNMSDVAASMGLAQLRKAERMWQRRRDIGIRYNAAFHNHPAFQLPADRADMQHAWHLYMLRLNLDRLRIDRAAFLDQLRARNIGCSVHFIPLHIHPYYRGTYGYAPEDFPVAYGEYMREISLPIYSSMTDEQVKYVIQTVLTVAGESQA